MEINFFIQTYRLITAEMEPTLLRPLATKPQFQPQRIKWNASWIKTSAPA